MTQPNARERLERFAQQFRDGDLELALSLIEALCRDFPDQAPLHWHHARALRALQRNPEAVQAIEQVIALKADYAPAWLMRAELHHDAGVDTEADLRHALALDPRFARAHWQLARWLLAAQRSDEARIALATALDLDPGLTEAYVDRADWQRRDAMLGFGDGGAADPDVIVGVSGQRWSRRLLEAARSDYQRALDLRNDARVRLHLAAVLHELGAFDQALAAYDAVLAVTPSDDPRYTAITTLRARSEGGGRGEQEQSAQMLEALLSDSSGGARASLADDLAASMVHGAAAAVRGGLSLPQALAEFVSEQPDDAQVVNIAWKIYALAHEPEPNFLVSALASYPKFMREYAEQVAATLGAQGFRTVGDYEPVHLAQTLGRPTLVRFYAANDGITCGTSYRIEPKWPGWMAFILLKLRGQWQQPAVVELETAFDDGGFLITNTAGTVSPFTYRGKVDLLALPASTSPAAAHARHRERIERYRREHPHATAERVDTEARILALQRRISAAKCAYRQSIGYVEDSELSQLLGEHDARLHQRVRDKLLRLQGSRD